MTGPTYLFLDSEWPDEADTELVSLAATTRWSTLTHYVWPGSL